MSKLRVGVSGSIVQPGCTIEVNAEGSVQAGGGEGLTGREREPWEIIYFKGTRAISNNVGAVKHFLGTLAPDTLPRHSGERHFALVEKAAIMSQPRLACNLSGEIQFDPTISPVNTFDHDYYFELPHEEGAECPIRFAVIYFAPWLFTGCSACEPNFMLCW